MKRKIRILSGFLLAMAAIILTAAATKGAKQQVPFEDAKIRFEFNSTDEDLGVQFFLDGGPWSQLKIVGPDGRKIFEVKIGGELKNLGWKELFGESEEPNFADMSREEILALFPEGGYTFSGKGVDGEMLVSTAILTHNIPDGPGNVTALLGMGNSLVINWDAVTTPPGINIVAYQVIVADAFQVTVPATSAPSQSVTVSPEFVASLPSGEHEVEVLAIEEGGNQTISSIFFMKP